MSNMDPAPRAISIWFFIGMLLAVYGVLIELTGIWELAHPPAESVVLAGLHANLWWGGLLFVAGLLWVLHYRPGR